jgi:hypothetical protein
MNLVQKVAAGCNNPTCLIHGAIVTLLVTRLLTYAEQLGQNAECLHQEIHLNLNGEAVSFCSSVRYQVHGQWQPILSAEAPSREEACLKLLLMVEAKARAAAGGPSA